MKEIILHKPVDILKEREALQAIGIVFGISAVAALVLNIIVVSSVMIQHLFPEELSVVLLAGSIFLSLAVVPRYLYKRITHTLIPYELDKNHIGCFLVLAAGLIPFVGWNLTVHFFAIALAEELLFRQFHYRFLEHRIGTLLSVIISAFIFAVLLHMGESLVANLMIRFPLGLLLGACRVRFGLPAAITAHWLYDILFSII